ncbi:hypothetical protein [Agromyces laixinhei]|uniref:hypothetical protein n=1 Tax=Agromyces laixinhei TaxID=2585717 RepID=UPI0012EECAAF|nr:hypothetical protein [Agromyces laixinhei]
MSTYPLPTPERRKITQQLAALAATIDDEAKARTPRVGVWSDIVRHELLRSAGTVRLVNTLIVNGAMSTAQAKFWLKATRDYVNMIRRADQQGVIR